MARIILIEHVSARPASYRITFNLHNSPIVSYIVCDKLGLYISAKDLASLIYIVQNALIYCIKLVKLCF